MSINDLFDNSSSIPDSIPFFTLENIMKLTQLQYNSTDY